MPTGTSPPVGFSLRQSINEGEERIELTKDLRAMTLALIAAGEGARLRSEGITVPKGLVPVLGVPLAKRTIDTFVQNGITEVKCIVNEESPALEQYLRETDFGVPVEIIVKSTRSSMHSLFTLSPLLKSSPFFLATVDAIYHPSDLKSWISRCRQSENADGILALTRFVDDEKPLYATLEPDDRISAIGDSAAGSEWITGGLYWFTPKVFDEIPSVEERGLERLRKFQEWLVERGYRLYGHRFGKIVDVDHRADIATAEAFINQWSGVAE
ncbi:MAG: NDP-sugar synthase [Candidatus Kapaibacterium sp.]